VDEETGSIPGDDDGVPAWVVRELIQKSLDTAQPTSNFFHVSAIEVPTGRTSVPRNNAQEREIEIGPPRSQRPPDGILTGFNDFDRIVGGLRAGEITTIAGLPSSGASTLVQNIARRIVTGAAAGTAPNAPGRVVVFCNLDIPNSQMLRRVIGAQAKTDFSTRLLRANDAQRLANAREKLSSAKLILTDNRFVSLDHIYGTWRERKERKGLDLIVLDRVNVLGVDHGGITPPLRETMTELKYLAEDLGVPVLLTYTAEAEMADEETHHLNPYGLPSAIQAYSDVLALIHRPDYWTLQNYLEDRDAQESIPEPQKGLEVGELHIARQTGGQPDTMRFVLNSRWGRIDNVIWD
jgi:replicative DNA helicase